MKQEDIRETTLTFIRKYDIDLEEYLRNPFFQGSTTFSQWMAEGFKDDSLNDNPYDFGTQDYDDWETGCRAAVSRLTPIKIKEIT